MTEAVSGGTTPPPNMALTSPCGAPSEVAAARAALLTIGLRSPDGPMTDQELDAFLDRQTAAFDALAKARAATPAELLMKMSVIVEWMDLHSYWLGDQEAELLRSCVRDLRAMVAA